MQVLPPQVVTDKRRAEEAEWKVKIEGLRRLHSRLLDKILISKRDLPADREREVDEYLKFVSNMQKKREGTLLEYHALQKKMEEIADIIDAARWRQDRLDDREQKLEERERNLNDRERVILEGEKRLTLC